MKKSHILLYLLGWLPVAVYCLVFSIQIARDYLFQSPSSWSSASGFLPHMSDAYFPFFGMYIHLIGGFTINVIGILQILPFIRHRYPIAHQVMGNIYCLATLLASIGGNIFIYTTGCVGGRNMDIAFSIFGWIMFLFTLPTYYYARTKQFKQHRDFSIRLWAQGIASPMYRIWYFIAALCGYQFSSLEDYNRPLDKFFVWWFFVPNLIVAEMVIFYLHQAEKVSRSAIKSERLLQDDPSADEADREQGIAY
jgi:hypothetical protein